MKARACPGCQKDSDQLFNTECTKMRERTPSLGLAGDWMFKSLPPFAKM